MQKSTSAERSFDYNRPMQPHTSAHREALQEQLSEVFLRRGFDGATLAQLADAAGLSKASLYHHFPGGKSEMAATLLRRACAQAQQTAFDKLLSEGDPALGLLAFLKGFERYAESGTRPCLVNVLAQAPDADISRHARLALSNWRADLEEAYDSLIAGKRKKARRLADQMLAELTGALHLATALEDPRLFRLAIKCWRKFIRTIS